MGQMKFDEAAMVLNRLSLLKTYPEELRNDLHMRTNSDDESIEGTVTKTNLLEKIACPIIFSNGKLMKITSILMIIWFTLSFGSYGISTWINTLFKDTGESNPYEDSFIFAAANLPGNIVSILLVDIYGRKKLLFFGMLLSAFSSIGFAIGKSQKELVVKVVLEVLKNTSRL